MLYIVKYDNDGDVTIYRYLRALLREKKRNFCAHLVQDRTSVE